MTTRRELWRQAMMAKHETVEQREVREARERELLAKIDHDMRKYFKTSPGGWAQYDNKGDE